MYFEVTWIRSELTAVYWKHLSRMPPGFVVAGDVKRSALLPLVEMGTAPPIIPGHDMLLSIN